MKHYVKTIEDLKERGGRSSGYAKDLRNDIYWATAYQPGRAAWVRRISCSLTSRASASTSARSSTAWGSRRAGTGWRIGSTSVRTTLPTPVSCARTAFDPDCREAYEILVKSFAPIAVFDKDYDELGSFPKPPKLKAATPAARKLIVYNDAFSDEAVELRWNAVMDGKSLAGETRSLRIPLGGHALVEITFSPPSPGEVRLELISAKAGKVQFQDSRLFVVE